MDIKQRIDELTEQEAKNALKKLVRFTDYMRCIDCPMIDYCHAPRFSEKCKTKIFEWVMGQ